MTDGLSEAMQTVGKACAICNEKIVAAREATWCKACGAPFHEACLHKADGVCVTCRELQTLPDERDLGAARGTLTATDIRCVRGSHLEMAVGLIVAVFPFLVGGLLNAWEDALLLTAVLAVLLLPIGIALIVHGDSRRNRER